MSLQPLTPQIAQSLKIGSDVRGVVVTAVDPNSDASDKGLQRGDVIISVNQQPVTTPAQVAAIVEAARKAGRTTALLLVKRGTDIPAFVGVEIPKRQRQRSMFRLRQASGLAIVGPWPLSDPD